MPTDYAVQNEALTDDDTGACRWWLRSPGFIQHRAAWVNNDGYVLEYGDDVDIGSTAVRPALWIDLNS